MDNMKVKGLTTRVYNNKMITDEKTGVSDEKDIKALCEKVFSNGWATPDPSALHNFNNILVETADTVAKQPITDVIALLSNMETKNPGDIVFYDIPQKNNVKVVWSALGSGVDLIRLGEKKKIMAQGKPMQFGAYYEPLDMVKDSVDAYRDAVNRIADAKVKLYLSKITDVVKAAITSSIIPAKNAKVASNVPLSDFRALESIVSRYGGKPIFMADELLIEHFANQFNTDATLKTLLTDELRKYLVESTNMTQVSRSVAVPFSNPFIEGSKNTKTELPVDIGYMFAGGQGKKPIYVTEFGGMTQNSAQDPEDRRIKLIITQEADITLISGEAIGYIEDDAVTV